MMQSSAVSVLASAAIVLVIIALAWYVVSIFSPGQPTAVAEALTGVAGMLTAVPPIIRAVRGR